MTYEAPPLVKAYIWACKQARDRQALEEWVANHRARMQEVLPPAEAETAIEAARQHWRSLGGQK